MKKYKFTCTCGYTETFDAADETAAKQMLMEKMNPEAFAAHFAERHAGEMVPDYDAAMAAIVLEEMPAEGAPMAN
jgi:hypothetical protein